MDEKQKLIDEIRQRIIVLETALEVNGHSPFTQKRKRKLLKLKFILKQLEGLK